MLPLIKTPDQAMTQLQTLWKSELDPLLKNPMKDGLFLPNIQLRAGETQIPHLLQVLQQGWIITDLQNSALIYRSRPFNKNFLWLISNVDALVSLLVY